jgi:hypothetical protein
VSIAWLLSAQAKEGDEEKVTGTELSCCLLLHKSSQSLGQKNIYPQYLKDEHFIYIYILEICRSLSLSLSLGVPHFSSLDLCCRRAMELSLVIRQTLEAAILTHLMPRSQVNSLAGFVPREWMYLSGLVCSCDNF